MKDIHKTPLEIQDELDKVKLFRGKQSNQIDFMGDLNEGIERHQFDLDVLVTSTLSTHMDTNSSSVHPHPLKALFHTDSHVPLSREVAWQTPTSPSIVE